MKAYMRPETVQNAELLSVMRLSSPFTELVLYECAVVEPRMEGEKPSRPYGEANICPSYHMVPIAFAERFCATVATFNALQPNVREIRQLAYLAHKERWSKFMKQFDLCLLPWPLQTVPTSVEDITISSLRLWVLVVLNNKYDWRVVLKKERDAFRYLLGKPKLIRSKIKREKYFTMLEKMCRVIENVTDELQGSPDVWAALGCSDIDGAYRVMIN